MCVVIKRTFGPVQDRIPSNPVQIRLIEEDIFWCDCQEVRIHNQGKIWFLGQRCQNPKHAQWNGTEV